MGKIVKYCAACDESFAEKFGFCPNCGQAMGAFEMNPLANEAKISTAETNDFAAQTPVSSFYETSPAVEEVSVSEGADFSAAVQTQPFFDDEFALKTEDLGVSDVEDEKVETQIFAATAMAGANGNGNGNQFQPTNYSSQAAFNRQANNEYRITVIEEKNVKQRNMLLLGSLLLMTTLAVGGTIYSLFNHNLLVGAINEDLGILVPVIDETPMDVEEPEKKDKDKGGGGGGGGREEERETSKGRLATQTEKPQIRPDVSIVQLTNPTIPIIASTQGKKVIPPTNERYGNPNSLSDILSNGKGKGGGQGEGSGDGQGTGRGSGAGSGSGSGFGSGIGDGDGDGTGSGGGTGRNRTTPPPPPVPKGVTEGIKITSKPKPPFTDAARQNQIQGVVRLRVTFLASGQIGSISPVQGLSGGLTEQAIAAARNIRFEPAKRNGVPYTVVKQVEYNFTLY
ncbi:MAG: energy transducer TonB [Acidobacteriota bacterium]|nr:energy transducer TonB [Acidobacteriota bacterium]